MKVETTITLEIDVKVTGKFVEGCKATYTSPKEWDIIEDIAGEIIDLDKQIEGYNEYIEEKLLEQYCKDEEDRKESAMEWKMERQRGN